jgi:hypothetical protein
MTYPELLGRKQNHDPLSWNYPARMVTPEFSFGALKPQVRLKRNVGPYEQRVGDCVLNTSFGIMSTKPNTHRYKSQRTMEKWYERVTGEDIWPGQWFRDGRAGSDDTGTDMNSAAKSLRDGGLLTRWEHIFTGVQGVLQALNAGQPVGTGCIWKYGMFRPDMNGRVRVNQTDETAGGHEWEWVGYDLNDRVLWGCNSWGLDWADDGYFCMDLDDYDWLVHQGGDATVLYPVNSVRAKLNFWLAA